MAKLSTYTPPTPNESISSDPYTWICEKEKYLRSPEKRCYEKLDELRSQTRWIVQQYAVDYCLAEPTPQRCTLEYNLPLAIIVICANTLKVVFIGFAVFAVKSSPLLTVGDGISSFLRRQEGSTAGHCLLTREFYTFRDRREVKLRLYSKFQRGVACCLFKLGSIGLKLESLEQYNGGLCPHSGIKRASEPLKYDKAPSKRWKTLSSGRWCTLLTMLVLFMH